MDSRQLALLARALNYNSGLQNLTVVVITELKEVSKIAEELEDAGADSLEIAVCGLMSRQKGNYLRSYL